MPVLFELRPRLPERGTGFFDIEPETRIGSVVYRIFKGSPPGAVAQTLDHVLPQIPLLSDRLSLLRTMGWRAERGEKLAPDEDLNRQANAVVDEALRRNGQELADEHELASLVYCVGQGRSKVRCTLQEFLPLAPTTERLRKHLVFAGLLYIIRITRQKTHPWPRPSIKRWPDNPGRRPQIR
jgi:hypothetical protein